MIERDDIRVGDRIVIHRHGTRIMVDRVNHVTAGHKRIYHTGGPTNFQPGDEIELLDREEAA